MSWSRRSIWHSELTGTRDLAYDPVPKEVAPANVDELLKREHLPADASVSQGDPDTVAVES
jgi:hypothetical protein